MLLTKSPIEYIIIQWRANKPCKSDFHIWEEAIRMLGNRSLEDWYSSTHIQVNCLTHINDNILYIFQSDN